MATGRQLLSFRALRTTAFLSAPLPVAVMLLLSGCGATGRLNSPTTVPAKSVSIGGHVFGGQQPVSNSTLQLYAVGTTGDGSPATALLSPPATTDSNGSFNITGTYTCPSSTAEVYLVSIGGNPGLTAGTNNPDLSMMAALGPCGVVQQGSQVIINELTTIGSLTPLAPYMSSYAALGSGTSDLAQFDAALAQVNEYTNTSTGTANGPGLAAGYDASSMLVNTLGDILASCVNSAGGVAGDGTACGMLFTLTTPQGGPAPTDTIGAALQILKNPTNISPALLNLVTGNSPFQPSLAAAPVSWAPAVIPIASTPAFSPGAGSFSSSMSVTLTDATPGATIYYTTDGSMPTTSSSVYSTPLIVSASETIQAFATALNYATSGIGSARYVFGQPTAPAPTFSIPSGTTLTTPTALQLMSSISGATIYYTTDGSAPTTSSLVYAGSILLSEAETVSAIVVASGYSNSAIASASYGFNDYGIIQTFAGNGSTGYAGDGGPATGAELTFPSNGVFDAAGNLYIGDRSNNVVRKVSTSGTITTYAGTGTAGYTGDGGLATQAEVANVTGTAMDASGNLYFSDGTNCVVRKVTPGGIISTVAGTGTCGYSGDGGPGTSAKIFPYGLAFDRAGNLYISDLSNSRIRIVNPYGVINTFAGNGTAGYSGDGGQATSAEIRQPYGLAFDQSGNLYVADAAGYRVRKITPSGIISTYAGNGTNGYSASSNGGQATSAALGGASGVAFDAAGNLYIAQYTQQVVRKVTPAGIISTVAGTATAAFSGDGGPATGAALDYPIGLAVDAYNNLYIMDARNSRVREVFYQSTPGQAAPTFSPVAGTYTGAQTVTITPAVSGAAIYYTTNGTTPTTASTLYTGPITVSATETVSAISVASGYTNSAVGTAAYVINTPTVSTPTFSLTPGSYSGTQTVTISEATAGATIYYTTNGTTPTTSSLLYTGSIVMTSSTTINAIAVLSGYNNSALATAAYTITDYGIISTVAGTGKAGYTGDNGPATSAELNLPFGGAVDASGNLYISDLSNQRIRKVTSAGVISTYAGTGTAGYSGDGGAATSAQVHNPYGMAVDSSGDLYFADYNNNVIRMITPAGVISTVVGNGTGGYNGDGLAPTATELYHPSGVAFDSSNNLYISDLGNNRIRKVSGGVVSTIAGTGTLGYSGDGGLATSANIDGPLAIALDAAANVYFADGTNRVREISAANGSINTVAGNGTSGATGDGGPATSAELAHPQGLAVDSEGNLYISAGYSGKVRQVSPSGIISTLAGTGVYGTTGDGGPSTAAELDYPAGLALDTSGDLYIVDESSDDVRKITFGATPGQAAPTFSPAPGTYTAVQSVTITPAVSGAVVYYTLDGSTPTASSTLYTGPVTVAASESIKAISVASGYLNSAVGTAAYVINLPLAATPSFSIAGGTYASAQSVTLSDTTTGAAIYYTLDGSTPTASSTLYTAAITVSASETINAIAVASGYANSAIATAAYVISNSTSFTISASGTAVSTITAGTVVTLTASVNSGGTTATRGQVLFCDTAVALCAVGSSLGLAQITSSGTATMRFIPALGVHTYEAIFLGTSSGSGSTSTTKSLTVTGPHPTTTTLAANGSTLTATVSANGTSATPSGLLSFYSASGSQLGLGSLGSPSATLSMNTAAYPATDPSGVCQAVTADFNNDGIPDVALGNGCAGPGAVPTNGLTVLVGKGNGTFTPATPLASLAGIVFEGLAAGDFNNDGIPDLLLAGPTDILLLLGHGDGTFAAPTTLPSTCSNAWLSVADFNNDGNADVIAACVIVNGSSYTATLNVFLGNGAGSFTSVTPFSIGTNFSNVAVGDFNNDGVQDITFVNQLNNGNVVLSVSLGKGDGTFTTAASPYTFSQYANYPQVVVADVNGDGKPDLVAMDTNSGGEAVLVSFLGNGNGTFGSAVATATPDSDYPAVIQAADFNGDGRSDIALATYSNIRVLLSNGDGTFTSTATAIGTTSSAEAFSMAIADFNGDGVPDLFASNSDDSYSFSILTQRTVNVTASVSGVSNPSGATAVYTGNAFFAASQSSASTPTKAAAVPVFSLPAGSYAASQTTTITSATAGATIYYTLDGTTPTTSSLVYAGPISIGVSQTINAMAAASGYLNSGVATAAYVIK